MTCELKLVFALLKGVPVIERVHKRLAEVRGPLDVVVREDHADRQRPLKIDAASPVLGVKAGELMPHLLNRQVHRLRHLHASLTDCPDFFFHLHHHLDPSLDPKNMESLAKMSRKDPPRAHRLVMSE